MFKEGNTPEQDYAWQALNTSMAAAILAEARVLAGPYGMVEDYFEAALRNLEKAQAYVYALHEKEDRQETL